MNNYHSHKVRVYTEDTDCYKIVYHSNYLKYAERGRTEAFRSIGGNLASFQENGMLFVIRSCLLNCLAPARLNDVLDVRTYFKKPGRAKLEVSQTIVREDQTIATLELVLACINPLGKPIRIDAIFAHTLWTHFGEFK